LSEVRNFNRGVEEGRIKGLWDLRGGRSKEGAPSGEEDRNLLEKSGQRKT